ncbi:amidohydrolase family protein [uncultured Victivallis sp.]|uniref:amidohydrolase family protein n=1 Tax=uncultured Victivallis sp. TaxID=354118 RepID=UPI0025D894A8|nr:amidohydrolase family protein [uncultured Victivallis sp.]
MSRIVDFHIHCNSSDPEQVKQLAETCEKYEVAAALVGGLRYGATDYVPNEQVIQICREYPDLFYPLAKIDFWEAPPNPDEASRLAEAGVRGFKFIYPYYAYDDDRYMPIYERIETLGLPVLFHTGDFCPSPVDAVWRRPVLRNMDPVTLDRIARSFPKLNIVMAHLGTSLWRVPAAELVKTHPNLYTDLAGHGSFAALSAEDLAGLLGPRRHVYGVERAFFHKLVFGSDAYVDKPSTLVSALDHYRHLLDRLGLPAGLSAEIMGGTVGRWLGIPL